MPGEPLTGKEIENIRRALTGSSHDALPRWSDRTMAHALATVDALTRKAEEKDAEIAALTVNHCPKHPASVTITICNSCDDARHRDDECGTDALRERVIALEGALSRLGDWRLDKAQQHVEGLRKLAATKADHDFIDRFSGWLIRAHEIVTTALLTPTPPGEKEK